MTLYLPSILFVLFPNKVFNFPGDVDRDVDNAVLFIWPPIPQPICISSAKSSSTCVHLL